MPKLYLRQFCISHWSRVRHLAGFKQLIKTRHTCVLCHKTRDARPDLHIRCCSRRGCCFYCQNSNKKQRKPRNIMFPFIGRVTKEADTKNVVFDDAPASSIPAKRYYCLIITTDAQHFVILKKNVVLLNQSLNSFV